ncbi:hypothetical protein LTR33_013197 [Friedmanniomyces endolithicus]|nr:hypothetical protein LTR33_013197 [Friedmanniomyces endolithicus]
MSDGSKVPVIGTHNGHFHADEALAVFLLRLLPEYRHASLVRTRDPELLKTCTIVVDAFTERTQYDPKGRIMVIPYRPEGVPWADHLHAVETEMQSGGQVLYALFAENDQPGCKWRIRAVSLEPGSFENRKGLPEAWRGVRDEELSKVSGVNGCVFVHASGFIGGNATFEGALEMAKKAVDV